MRHKRRILVIIAAIAMVLAFLAWRFQEPTYEDKGISQWIRLLPSSGAFNSPSQSNEPSVKAVESLGTKAVPHLVKAMISKESALARTYAKTWPRLPSFAKRHLPQPTNSIALRRKAAFTLAQVAEIQGTNTGVFEVALPAFAETVRDPDPQLQSAALHVLARISAKWNSQRATDILINELSSPHASVRRSVAYEFSNRGASAGIALPALRRLLNDQDTSVRLAGAMAVYRISGESEEAVPVLMEALQDKEGLQRANAASYLGHMGPQTKNAVPGLIQLLENPDVFARGAAAEALQKIAPESEQVVSALLKALAVHQPGGSWMVGEALWKIDHRHGPAIVKATIDTLCNTSSVNRHMAARLLGNMGSVAQPALPVLIEGLSDPEHLVPQSCAFALLMLGVDDPLLKRRAFNVLIEALKKWGDEDSRSLAARLLGELGPAAKEHVPLLREALHDGVARVRETAAEALRKIVPVAEISR